MAEEKKVYSEDSIDRDSIEEGDQFDKYQLAGFQRVENLEPDESGYVT